MKKGFVAALAMIVAVSALVFSSHAENISLRGEYVEVRTASVFAGACHFNGEVVTTGRDAATGIRVRELPITPDKILMGQS